MKLLFLLEVRPETRPKTRINSYDLLANFATAIYFHISKIPLTLPSTLSRLLFDALTYVPGAQP